MQRDIYWLDDSDVKSGDGALVSAVRNLRRSVVCEPFASVSFAFTLFSSPGYRSLYVTVTRTNSTSVRWSCFLLF